jgi:hypothetical protein
VTADHVQRDSSYSPRSAGGHEDRSRGWVLLEVLLHDVAAHGVSDEHQLVTEHVDGGAYIVDIVGDGT